MHKTTLPCIYILAMMLCSLVTVGQEQTAGNTGHMHWKDKLFFGGGLGLQFGNATLIDVSPMVGIKPAKRLNLGISPSYKYMKVRNYAADNSSMQANIWGIGVFGQFNITENLFAHTEYERLLVRENNNVGLYSHSFDSFFVGGGYRQIISQNLSANIIVLWNLNDTEDSPYNNPVVRMGFSLGL